MSILFEPTPSEILFLKEKIFSPKGCHVFFDVDGTLKSAYTSDTPAGFDPQLPSLLEKLNGVPGVSVGACTSQSPQELHAYLLKMDSVIDGALMNGLSILEDGHILVDGGTHMLTESIELISPEAKVQIASLSTKLKSLWVAANDPELLKEDWGFFPGVSTPIAIPSGKYQGAVTLSIWERGPDIHDPSYHGQYDEIMEFVASVSKEQGFNLLDFKEAGNGTLRVLEKGKSKEWALATLAEKGILDLSRTVYSGDGLNDVDAMTLVTKSGGAGIAVANAIPDLKKVATYNCKKNASHGISEALNLIFSK